MSQYKHVTHSFRGGKKYYIAKLNGIARSFTTEREAAIYADKLLIQVGRAPVNILKPKQ